MNCNQLTVLCHLYRGAGLEAESARGNFRDDLNYLKRREFIENIVEPAITQKGRIFIETCLGLEEVVSFKVKESAS